VDLRDKSILITGGTGSFGHAFAQRLLDEHDPRRVIIYSRDELKQAQMMGAFPSHEVQPGGRLRFFVGDVRDLDRLSLAVDDVQIIVHAAALKRVDACESNPTEAVRTNIGGTRNVIRAALDSRSVERVVALSSDKACAPTNLYGATKLCTEKLVTAANAYSGKSDLRFACTRYGNISGSRGSVIPFFRQRVAEGAEIPVTHMGMTRFWMHQREAVDLVFRALFETNGGEVFIPQLMAYTIRDLVTALDAPKNKIIVVGMRQGEKLHESLISQDEMYQGWYGPTGYVLAKTPPNDDYRRITSSGTPSYSSNTVSMMSVDKIRQALKEV
jgi:UDP-N-acetylglucosamine 4,6-dehydratase